MNRVGLVAEADTLRASPGGSATANIWLEINGMQFPGRPWDDFVVVIMGWWALALLRLLRGASSRESVPFMEGPYTVEVGISPSGILRFRALERSAGDRVHEVAAGEESAIAFASGLLSQAAEVLDACKRQTWWSEDARTLESSLEALKKECRTAGGKNV